MYQLTGKSWLLAWVLSHQQRKAVKDRASPGAQSPASDKNNTNILTHPSPQNPTGTNLRGLWDQRRAGRKLLLSLESVFWRGETSQEEHTAQFFSHRPFHPDGKDAKPAQKAILPRFCHYMVKHILQVNSTHWLEIISLYSKFEKEERNTVFASPVPVPREN